MRVKSTILMLVMVSGVACAATPAVENGTDSAKIAAYIKSLPQVKPPVYSENVRLALAGNPLGCEEHLQGFGFASGPGAAYLWRRDGKPELVADYSNHLAFYGCADWHSAVNSSWMMVSLIKNDPNIVTGQAIKDDLERRFQKQNIEGEMNYFNHIQGTGADFEKPYGYAWLLKLYGELKTWDDPEGRRSAAAIEPMVPFFQKAFSDYLKSLNYPIRIGLHPNTALDMGFVLDYTARTHDTELEATIRETAMRLFSNDKRCPTEAEPVFNEFASPCLVEAAVMARLMPPADYAKWLSGFLPPVYSEEFSVYSSNIDDTHGSNRDTTGTPQENQPNAHMIGLNFQRAADLLWIIKGLPPSDPRVPAYQKLADVCGRQGYDKIGLGGYGGTHWLATYALMYENLLENH